MAVLTEKEALLMKGIEEGNSSLKKDAEAKLHMFQRSKINPDHVDAINRLIPQAIAIADEKEPGVLHNSPGPVKDRWSRNYHHAMNRLCREAGLRG